MSTKSQATTAKKKLATQLQDDTNCVGVGITKVGTPRNGDETDSYAVALRFSKKPTKKLMTALTKAAGDVPVQSEVVGEVKALPTKTVKKAAKKSKAKKATAKTSTKTAAKKVTTQDLPSITACLKNATVAINQAMEQLTLLKTIFPIP